MFFNMPFTWEQLKFMFQEIRRVSGSNGFNFFSVRKHNDRSFGKGKTMTICIFAEGDWFIDMVYYTRLESYSTSS
jgi:hypothetical protein